MIEDIGATSQLVNQGYIYIYTQIIINNFLYVYIQNIIYIIIINQNIIIYTMHAW